MSKSDAASIISRAVKRARTEPSIRSKFRLLGRTNLRVFPKQMRQTLKYVTTYNQALGAVSGAATSAQFRANSLFDPDVALGGHQPYGYDQLAAMYQKYVVVSSSCVVTLNIGSLATYSGEFGVNVADTTAPSTNRDTLMESQMSSWKNFISTNGPLSVKLNFDASKYFDVKDLHDSDDLIAAVSANPTRQAYFNVWAAPDSGLIANTVYITVAISYDVLFFEPAEVTGS
jgi:hypothetical protein